jgi:hypothetical protein
MTWKEIKKAVEEAGVTEEEQIARIECEVSDSAKTFHKVRLGKAIKLAENTSDDPEDYSGCAV